MADETAATAQEQALASHAVGRPASGLMPAMLLTHRAVTAEWLSAFCSSKQAGSLTTTEVVTQIIRPETEALQTSYAQLVHSSAGQQFGRLTFFVSHAWMNSFGKLVEVVADTAARWRQENGQQQGPFFWIDCLAINQHRVEGELEHLADVLRDSEGGCVAASPTMQLRTCGAST